MLHKWQEAQVLSSSSDIFLQFNILLNSFKDWEGAFLSPLVNLASSLGKVPWILKLRCKGQRSQLLKFHDIVNIIIDSDT